MEVEVDGITYESDIEQDFGCWGCVAENNMNLCGLIYDQYGYCLSSDGLNIIWIKKETK